MVDKKGSKNKKRVKTKCNAMKGGLVCELYGIKLKRMLGVVSPRSFYLFFSPWYPPFYSGDAAFEG